MGFMVESGFTRVIGLLAALSIAGLGSPATAQGLGTLKVAVTLPDLVPIVGAVGGDKVEIVGIMPAGADPHGFTLTADAVAGVESCDLIVYGNSGFLNFERELAEAMGEVDAIDWPDYERHGAILKSFPGFENNQHGFWLGFQNAKAIAAALAEALMLKGVDASIVTGNLAAFVNEIDGMEAMSRQLMQETGRERSVWVAMVPGVAYTIDNLGLGVAGFIYYSEGPGFASGSDLQSMENKLRSGECAGVVCPLSMRQSKAGETAEQLSGDTGAPVCYVRFLDAQADDSYLAQAAYNAGAIAAVAAQGSAARSSGGVTASGHAAWGIIVFALLIALVMQNKRMYYTGGAMVSGRKQRKK